MDIPDEVNTKSYKKAPKLKNLRRASFSNYNDTLDVKDVPEQITKHRRASFGNSLSVELAITMKKSKSTEFERKSREKSKKKILKRMRSTESKIPDSKSSKISKLRSNFAKSRKSCSLDLSSKETLNKQKFNFEIKKEMKKLKTISDKEPDSGSRSKPTTLTGKHNNRVWKQNFNTILIIKNVILSVCLSHPL